MFYLRLLLISAFLTLYSNNLYAGLFGPSNYDECLLENLKGVNNNHAVALITQSCQDKFLKKDLEKKGNGKISEVCNLYWNGKRFLIGDVSSNKDFTIMNIAYFGVELIHIGIPSSMYKTLKFDDHIGGDDFSSTDWEGGKFMNRHLYELKDLCGIK